MNVVAREMDVALRRAERPGQVEEILAVPETVNDEPPLLVEDGPSAFHFPNELGFDVGPNPKGVEPDKGFMADPVAEGRAVTAVFGFDAAVKGVVETDVPVRPLGLDGVGEPERAVMRIRLRFPDEHVFSARAPHRPVMDDVEVRAVLINDGFAASDRNGERSGGVVSDQLDLRLRCAGGRNERGNA